jgi:hypothetical protein
VPPPSAQCGSLYVDTEAMFLGIFEQLRRSRIIP